MRVSINLEQDGAPWVIVPMAVRAIATRVLTPEERRELYAIGFQVGDLCIHLAGVNESPAEWAIDVYAEPGHSLVFSNSEAAPVFEPGRWCSDLAKAYNSLPYGSVSA